MRSIASGNSVGLFGLCGLRSRDPSLRIRCPIQELQIKVSRTCRARFPADQGCLYATAKTLPVGSHSSFRLKPSRSSGAPSAPAAFGGGLASLGLAKLLTWLSSAAAYSLCRLYSSGGLRKGRPLDKYKRMQGRLGTCSVLALKLLHLHCV